MIWNINESASLHLPQSDTIWHNLVKNWWCKKCLHSDM